MRHAVRNERLEQVTGFDDPSLNIEWAAFEKITPGGFWKGGTKNMVKMALC